MFYSNIAFFIERSQIKMAEENIRSQVLSGTKWNAIANFSKQGVSFCLSIVLARLLMPEEFGLLAMIAIFTNVAQLFVSAGLGSALIQKKDCTNDDYSTVFYFNIVVSLFFYMVLFFTAPLIARFYNQPILVSLVRWSSLSLLIGALGMVQQTIFYKELKFKLTSIISIVAAVVSAVVGITMALLGCGVYALVGQMLASMFVSTIIVWVISSWRPQLIFSKKSFKELFGFGSKLLASGLLETIYSSIDSLLIGKIFSAELLGFYTRAKSTKDLPINNTTSLIASTLFPIFSKITDDGKLADVSVKIYSLFAYIVLPLMAGLIVVAAPFIEVLYSAKWLPATSYLQIICVSGVVYPLSLVLCQVILAKGASGVFFILEIWKKVVGTIAMLIGLCFGIESFLWALNIGLFLALLLNIYYVAKVIPISKKNYILSLLPSLLLSIFMMLIVFVVGKVVHTQALIQLVIMCSVGVVVYISASRVFRIKEYFYIEQIITDWFKSKFLCKRVKSQ